VEETLDLSKVLEESCNIMQRVRFSISSLLKFLNGAISRLDGNHQCCDMDRRLRPRDHFAVEMASICLYIQNWGKKRW
jgi:hypothetical protein